MNELTFDELDLVAGGDGEGFSIGDGLQYGAFLGSLGGLGSVLTGGAGLMSVGDAMTLGAALGGVAGMAAVAVGVGAAAAYRYYHQPGNKTAYQP